MDIGGNSVRWRVLYPFDNSAKKKGKTNERNGVHLCKPPKKTDRQEIHCVNPEKPGLQCRRKRLRRAVMGGQHGGGWVNGWRQVGSGVGVHDRGCRRCLRGRRCSAELAAGVLEIR